MEETRRTIKIKLGTQIFMLAFILVFLAVGVMGYLGLSLEKAKIQEEAENSIQVQLNMEKAMFDLTYPGHWEAKDGILYKGGKALNDQNTIIDSIMESTNGNLATIFLGDTRIATTVKDQQGKRKTGTQAAPAIVELVLVQGKAFIGNANVAGTTVFSAYEPIRSIDDKVIGMIYIGNPKVQQMIEEANRDALLQFLWIGLIIMLVTIVITFVFSKRITKRIKVVESRLLCVTQGDLSSKSIPVTNKDEIGSLTIGVNRMNDDLRQIVIGISEVTHQVAAASEELSAISQQTSASTEHVGSLTEKLADSADRQLILVRNTADTVDTMTDEMKRIAVLSGDVNILMNQASTSAREGHEQGKLVVDQMHQVMKSNNQTYAAIGQLAERSGEIGGIVSIIRNISTQTNLLALNAAIEAARAGESGRGFAVVASEVRKLAEQSTESADQVALLVEAILNETKQAAEWVAADQSTIKAGTILSERINDVLSSIQSSVDQVAYKLDAMSSAIKYMDEGSAHISGMMGQVRESADHGADATQQVSATCEEQLAAMEEIASSSQALASQAELLQEMLSRFRL
ncbi:MAG: methyl-accepting chemotaxis protein [Gorillibacterium sp.]|nr:methyl-accepting chemotaxis protein [Gorillibacterium sp.]